MAGLIDLDDVALGSGGFKIQGEAGGDAAGWSVSSAGDVNGDGVDDVIVGAPHHYGGGNFAGAAYVVFGKAGGFATPVDLDAVAAGSGGFKIPGEAGGDWAGRLVSSAGDVNGDGFDDVIVGAARNDSGGYNSGAAYVVFGKAAPFATPVDLDAIAAGSGGFKIQGEPVATEFAGWSVSSAGDVNGDGLDDVIVGAHFNDSGGSNAGAAYVVFGKDVEADGGFANPVNLDDVAAGSGGFKIQSEADNDQAGFSVSSAGDVNGDNFDDVIVGALYNTSGGNAAGAAYVVFGKAGGFATPIDLDAVAAGSGGFKIQGENAGDRAGYSVSSAGDVNGDGFDDVIVGADHNDSGGGNAGAAYVVFGKASGFTMPVDLDAVAAGSGGFKIQGETVGDLAGRSVSSAGDVNGDGFADLIVGAPNNNSGGDNAGAAYVIFGKAGGFANPVDLDTVAAGSGGFKIQGENGGDEAQDGIDGDWAGWSVSSAGDDNGDGLDDLIVGAFGNESGGAYLTGAAYVIHGFVTGPEAESDAFSIGESGILAGSVLADNGNGADSDPQGDTLTVVGVGVPSGNVGTAVAGSNGGLFTIAANGALTFDPNGQFESLFAGQARATSVTYTITERDGGFDTATATVMVQGANEADIFTGGNDTRDLNTYNLDLYTNAQATRALGGNDIVQLSQTQNLGVVFEAGAGNDTVTGSNATDRIHGDGGKDRLLGEAGNDSLWGDAGDNSLSGGSGNDLLHAGDGFDFLTGGAGNDSFVFAESGTAASPDEDAVTDFGFGVGATGKDVIDLRAFDLADWTGSDSQITVAGTGGSRTIYVDLDDDNSAANNTSQAEVLIFVNAGVGGFVRNFVISDSNPLADILV